MLYVTITTDYYPHALNDWSYSVHRYRDFEGGEYLGVVHSACGYKTSEMAHWAAVKWLDGEYGELWMQV